jgi:hypothetical protein
METGLHTATARIDPIDLENAVRHCVHGSSAGRVVSIAQAIEELRIESGDFVSSDKELAEAISRKALLIGCAVLFDEIPGAKMTI